MNNLNRSIIMKQAWALKSQFPVLRFSYLLKRAWGINELRQKMQCGAVEFSFLKANGEVRKANGTLLKGYATTSGTRPHTTHKQFGTFPYYDLDKNSWRSFKIASLIDDTRLINYQQDLV